MGVEARYAALYLVEIVAATLAVLVRCRRVALATVARSPCSPDLRAATCSRKRDRLEPTSTVVTASADQSSSVAPAPRAGRSAKSRRDRAPIWGFASPGHPSAPRRSPSLAHRLPTCWSAALQTIDERDAGSWPAIATGSQAFGDFCRPMTLIRSTAPSTGAVASAGSREDLG